MAGSEVEVKECWYSILGVEQTASPEVIRSSYRKEALKWHPDKIQQSGASPKECQQATVRFQNIVQAYEVLSDPVERAWYDKHRSEILSSGSASKDFEFSVFSFFSPSAFSGFGDRGRGFYKVYKDVFFNIHKKEQLFAKAYGMGPIGGAPQIGNPSTPYAEVEEFYKYWTGFTTVKDFSWCDQYQVSQAANRKMRRLMEEENAKIRKRERREYSEAVRELATFVKKRDKRWLERQVELQRMQKDKEKQWKLRKEKLQQEKLAKALAFKEQEWTKVFDHDIDEVDVVEDANEGSYSWKNERKKKSDEQDFQEFYCIVCNKRFRSEKQWKNHERSKKHIERALSLKQSFLDEDDRANTAVKDLDPESDTNECVEKRRETAGGCTDRVPWKVTEELTHTIGRHDGTAAVPDFGKQSFESPQDKSAACRISITNVKRKDEKEIDEGLENEDEENLGQDDEDGMLAAMMNSHMCRQAFFSMNIEASLEVDAQSSLGEPREQDREDLASDSTDSENGGTVDGDDEENLLISILKSHQTQSRSSSDDLIGTDNPEAEVPGLEGRSTRVGVEEEMIYNNNLGKVHSRRRTKAQKKHMTARGRHDDLVKELSATPEPRKVVQNGSSDGESESEDLLVGTKLDVEDVKVSQSSMNRRKEKKLQRGQKRGKLEVCGKQGMLDSNRVTAVLQQNEHIGKKGSTTAKKGKGATKPACNTCDTCGEDFDSRNQLFCHISSTNHAALKSR